MSLAKFHVKVLTIFPELFPGTLGVSVLNRSLSEDIWKLDVINIRDFAKDKHKHVDEYVIGGGSGMLLKPDVLGDAIDNSLQEWSGQSYRVIYMSPRGVVLNQKLSQNISSSQKIIIICGRFEGIDERVIEYYNIEEVSIGDYILSGGEIAAQVLIDSCVRLLPGVLGNTESAEEESFSIGIDHSNILEYPHYTKPQEWRGMKVPEILFSGNHASIQEWRMKQALEKTKQQRLDLYSKLGKD
ncbi:MAG: tRNA (guanosine(37)-N1)-methyltransferase TrmD [Rickettsiales bacterium]|nr:tRNA (guanosine(37)-N1)-methyltransferase TrmD [Rickettsiales bacterium]